MMVNDRAQVYDQIFDHITKVAFGSDVYGDEGYLKILKEVIPIMDRTITLKQIDDISMKMAMDIASNVSKVNVNKLKIDDEKRVCFEAIFIMLYALRPENSRLIHVTTSDLLNHYPEFQDVDECELNILLTFRNVMRVAQELIAPRFHKKHLLQIVTRIAEGRNQKYITGSGQTAATNRRVLIYEREGNITPLQRPPRKSEILKRKALEDSEMEMKKLRMENFHSDEVPINDMEMLMNDFDGLHDPFKKVPESFPCEVTSEEIYFFMSSCDYENDNFFSAPA
jgi:hypothetical protein